MKTTRFDELTSLYLDGEISPAELMELRAALQTDLPQRQRFDKAWSLHVATVRALNGSKHVTGLIPESLVAHLDGAAPKVTRFEAKVAVAAATLGALAASVAIVFVVMHDKGAPADGLAAAAPVPEANSSVKVMATPQLPVQPAGNVQFVNYPGTNGDDNTPPEPKKPTDEKSPKDASSR